MHRLALALTLVVVGVCSIDARQLPFPQRHNNTGMPALLAAANAGDSEAMLHLGIRFSNGTDVPRDYSQAAAWYRKAADHGEPSGMFMAGIGYWNGQGVTQDFVEAYKWLDLSAKYGNATERDRAVGARTAIGRVMTTEMINEALRREAVWEQSSNKLKKLH